MDMVKLSIMGWGDHPELGSWPNGVIKGLNIYYAERPVISVTSVTVPQGGVATLPVLVVLP